MSSSRAAVGPGSLGPAAAIAASLFAGCAAPAGPASRGAPPVASSAASPPYRYEVVAGPDAEELRVVVNRDAGGTALRDLRRQLGGAAVTTDLDALWIDLGVRLVGRTVVYDDTARLAAIRRSIAARR